MQLLFARGRFPDGVCWARLLAGLIEVQWHATDASTSAKVTLLGLVGVVGAVLHENGTHVELSARILFIDLSIKLGHWPTLP